jgi:hypothetical protein
MKASITPYFWGRLDIEILQLLWKLLLPGAMRARLDEDGLLVIEVLS